MGDDHPEQPARLHKINDQIIASGLEYVVHFSDALPANKENLSLAHDEKFVNSVFDRAPKTDFERVWIDDDTIMMDKSLNAALHAAGAATMAVDLVMEEKSKSAFCATRPPGHHAGHKNSAGFCIFNNVAVGARYAIKKYGLKRIAIIDFDVHHGDGTEDIVKDDERILFCSSFQHPFYPFSGDKPTRDGIYNIPIPAGTTGATWRELVSPWLLHIDEFAPELIMISAGFDAHAEEELGYLRLVEDDYVWITQALKELADKHCDGKIVSVLEGGYALSALARSVVAHIKTLAS
jgi:acetoin utilization deacetylase AcuC-like enzyme